MPVERKGATLPGFFKFTEKGMAIAGSLKGVYTGIEESTFAILTPCITYNGKGKKGKVWAAAAIQMSADLRAKIDSDRKGVDNDKLFTVTFTGTEPSSKGSPKKVFRVEELSKDEMRELAKDADQSERTKPYPKPDKPEPTPDDDGKDEDGDELPF